MGAKRPKQNKPLRSVQRQQADAHSSIAPGARRESLELAAEINQGLPFEPGCAVAVELAVARAAGRDAPHRHATGDDPRRGAGTGLFAGRAAERRDRRKTAHVCVAEVADERRHHRAGDIGAQMRNVARAMTPQEIDAASRYYADQP